MTDAEDRNAIFSGNWRQGSLLPDQLVPQVRWSSGDTTPPSNARLVVISHSCDLLSDDFEREPVAEVVGGVRITELDPIYTHARNPRRIELEVSESSGERTYLGLEIRWKGAISRRQLAGFTAGAEVADASRVDLQSWLKGRYCRAALPDQFNLRLKPHRSKIIKIVRKARNGQPLAILFALGDNATVDLEPDQPYRVWLKVVLEGTAEPGDAEWEQFEREIYEPLVAELQRVAGIVLVEHQLVSEDEVTWREVRVLLLPLEFEYLTNALAGSSA